MSTARDQEPDRPPALGDIEWGECLLPPASASPALTAAIRKQFGGMVPHWVTRLAPSPWLVQAFHQLVSKPIAHAPPDVCELIALVVSQDNSCRYCYSNQRAFLKMLGHRADYIAQLERDFHVADFSPAERAALDFARKISRSNPRPDREDYAALVRAGYSPPAIAELAFTAVTLIFANRVSTLLALPPEPFVAMVDRPLFRLLRPLVARRARARPRRPEPLPEPNDGPFAAVVATLAGSPSARVLRGIIDASWASDRLPRRTKALMVAVIGKALGCSRAEIDAGAELAGEDLGPDDLAQILTHLGSPKLDAREAVLIPFARETVRFQRAITIQTRMREVSERLGPEATLEAIGIVALSNAVCRLSVLVDIA